MPVITVSLPADGTTADVADYNVVVTAMLAVINGLLDSDNLANNAVTTAKIADSSVTNVKLAADAKTGWNVLATSPAVPSTITANGRRSFTAVFNGVDLTGIISKGMRVRGTRNTAAPTQSTSLNGTTQYYSNAAPAGMTFTDDFVVGAWVKLSSITGLNQMIASRYNGTSGWALTINGSGQVALLGYNAGAANFSVVTSNESIPLNKWVYVCAQLDMSTFTATTTTSYVMINGVDVPSIVSRGGTNPTALVQAGNVNIGAANAASLFSGKIAQVSIYSAKVTQAVMLAAMNQALAGSETSLVSAYSFNNVITDLNTSNANNLTANGSAVATNADSPFAEGATAGSYEYGIITDLSFSTNTTVVIQAGDGGVWPVSGGFSAFAYSPHTMPLNFPSGLLDNRILAHTKVPLGGASGSTANSGVASTVVTIPPGRSIKVTGMAAWGNFNTSQNSTSLIGVVIDGTLTIANGIGWINGSAAQSNNTEPVATSIFTPTPGQHTLSLSFSLGGGFQMSTYSNVELIVELV